MNTAENSLSASRIAQFSRIAWIDTAKLIGMYLVILGHLPLASAGSDLSESFVVRFIYSFHMPLFFFLAGLVEKNRSPKETAARSFRNLIVPYLCFYLVTYAWWLCVSFLRHPELFERSFLEGFVKPLFGMFIACGFDTDYSHMTNVPLWFLVALFWCRLFNALGNKKAFFRPVFCFVGICVAVILWKSDRFLPFSFGAACMAFPFYYAGVMLQNRTSAKTDFPIFAKSAAFVVSLVFTVLFAKLNGRVDVNGIGFGKNPILFYCDALFGIAMTLSLAMMLPKLHSFGSFLAQNTLVILAFHSTISGIALKAYKILVLKSFAQGKIEISSLEGIIIAFIVLVVSFVPCVIIRKFFPFMLGNFRKRSDSHITAAM